MKIKLMAEWVDTENAEDAESDDVGSNSARLARF